MLFSDRQLLGLVALGGLVAWGIKRQATALVSSAGDAVSDSAWWYGHQAEQGYGAALSVSWDEFDKKHRPYSLTDESNTAYKNYQRWKQAVLDGKLEEPAPLIR